VRYNDAVSECVPHAVSKLNGKIFFFHLAIAYRRSRVLSLHIFNLGVRWRWVVNITLRLLYLKGTNPESIKWEAGWDPEPK